MSNLLLLVHISLLLFFQFYDLLLGILGIIAGIGHEIGFDEAFVVAIDGAHLARP